MREPLKNGSSIGNDERLKDGIRLFNAGSYFEAHEVWEELWRHCHPQDRNFVQALIHLAVALHHWHQGNVQGAERQLRKALKKISVYPRVYGSLDTLRLSNHMTKLLEQLQGCPSTVARVQLPTVEPEGELS